jgi:hypothetical protein
MDDWARPKKDTCLGCAYGQCDVGCRAARKQRDELVGQLVELFGWQDDPSYLHASLHVRDAVLNLRADLGVVRAENEELAQRERVLEQERDNLRRVVCQGQLSMVSTDAARTDAVLRGIAQTIWGAAEAERLYPPDRDGTIQFAVIVRDGE